MSIGKKPPMGWNTWNTFGSNISEKLIMETADVMVEEGFLAAGYEYLVIDDCWSMKERDKDGCLVPDQEKFPNGIKAVSDYVHSKGLKFGMYSCAGILTCAGYPGSYDHEFQDAKTFADWGVDFLKYDFCNFPEHADNIHRYHIMSMALKSTGRDILFSACNWGQKEPWKWMSSIGAHMYRSTGDIMDNFISFTDIVKSQLDNFCCSGQYCYNDMDMLTVGMYNKGNVGIGKVCTDEEYRIQFSLWCLFGAPLMIGADIRELSEFSKSLLLQKELIAINQDEECRPPYIARRTCVTIPNPDPKPGEHPWTYLNDSAFTFIKHVSNREFILAFYNLSEAESDINCIFADCGLPYSSMFGFDMVDIFTGEKLGVKRDFYKEKLKAHDCKLFRCQLVRCDDTM